MVCFVASNAPFRITAIGLEVTARLYTIYSFQLNL